MKVTFTTVPKSAAKYGMSTMGRLWKELHLQGLARRRDMQRAQRCWSHKKLTNRLESFDFFLCRWKYVHLPFTSACLAGSWSVLYPNYWGFIRLFTKRLCWLSWCDREVAVFVATVAAAAAADDEKQRDLLWPNVFSSSILPPPFFCLFSLPVCSASFRTNWCCLCANLLSRNTP